MFFKRLSSTLRFVEDAIYRQPVPNPNDVILVAMSGGVDSSVCAALYAQTYKNVRGIFMQNWSSESKCSETDWKDVQEVADHIGIPCDRVNFERDYWEHVFTPMIEGYKAGVTPNPDVGCNKHIKFGRLMEHLNGKYGEDNPDWWLVTGHYARIMTHQPTQQRHLLRGVYKKKDQSFYLSSLPKGSLSRTLLPIGHYEKPDVRMLAKKFALPTAERPDSQGLCFVSQKGNFRDFLNDYIEPNPGKIVLEDGSVCGEHSGLWHATVGQKSGVCMPQGDPKYKGVWFVSEKRPDTNELVIVKGSNNPSLFKNSIEVLDWEWLGNMSADQCPPVNELSVQFRSLQAPLALSTIENTESGLKFGLSEEDKGVAPGQSLVLYHGDRVLGTGLISATAKI